MSTIEEKIHPTLGVRVRSDGQVLVPGQCPSRDHWTYGTRATHNYCVVRIRHRRYSVHNLVAETFIGPIPEGMEVDHIDRDPTNNAVCNLRICTHKENMRNTAHWDRCEQRVGVHRSEDIRAYNRLSRRIKAATPEGHARFLAASRRQDAKRKLLYSRVVIAGGKVRWILKERAGILVQVPKHLRTEEMVQAARADDAKLLQQLVEGLCIK